MSSIKAFSVFYFILFVFSLSASAEDKVQFDHIEQNTIFYKSNPSKNEQIQSFKTNLFELKYLDTLNSRTGGLPYFLVSANPCANCSNEKAIYLIRPQSDSKPTAFVYPGKILDPKNRELLMESRSFYGECLPGRKDIYLVFQKEKVDRRSRLQNSVYLAEPQKEYLSEKLIERRLPNIHSTLKLVKAKRCKEIDSRKRFMSNKFFNLQFPIAEDRDDDDDDEKNGRTIADDSGAIAIESESQK